MAYSPAWRVHWLQERQLPALVATARRHAPVLEEFVVVDLAPGRAVVMPPLRPCGYCWGQRKVFDVTELGLCPVLCPRCAGDGWEPPR